MTETVTEKFEMQTTQSEHTSDALGDKLKEQEGIQTKRKALKIYPLMARLDGRAFHTFTKGLARPYDERLSTLMVDTAKYLVEHTHAKLGYTQSDEITLTWYLDPSRPENEYLFDGKFQKLTSVLAGMASAYFTKELAARIPEKANLLGVFDCRVWEVPDMVSVYENFVWRQDDAIKNSISMAAQARFSAKQLHGVGSEAKKAMLREIGRPWEKEPVFFKSGSFVKRKSASVYLTAEQLSKIPKQHWPTGPVTRTSVEVDNSFGYVKGDFNPESFKAKIEE